MAEFRDVEEFAKYSVCELIDKHEPYHEVYRAINKKLDLQVLVVVVYRIKSALAYYLLNFYSDLILPPLEQYRADNSLYIVYQLPTNVYFLADYVQANTISEELAWSWFEYMANFLVEIKNKELLLGSLSMKHFVVINETYSLLYYGSYQLFNEFTYMQDSVKRELYTNDVRIVGQFMAACCNKVYFTSLLPRNSLISASLLLYKSTFPTTAVQIAASTPLPERALGGYSRTFETLIYDCVADKNARITAEELIDHPVISPTSCEQSILSYRHFYFTDFDIIKNVGIGAYGRVDLAIHKKSYQQCVLKQSSNLAIQRFEEGILRKLSHPNVVRFYGAFEERNISYICMQYCNQGDLFRHITAKGKPSPYQALKWIAELASALYHMHENGLIHRDIKPQNILISDGAAYIADFGVAKLVDAEASTVVGTPLYFSPEIFNKKPYGKPTDVFSLGLVFFNILVGSHLFTNSLADMTKFFRDLENNYTIGDIVDYVEMKQLRSLIVSMLRFDPVERFTMAQVCYFPLIQAQIAVTGLPGPGCRSVLSLQRVIRSDFDLSALFVQVQDVQNQLIKSFKANQFVLKQAFVPLLQFLPNYIKTHFNLPDSQYIRFFSRCVALNIQYTLINRQFPSKIHDSSVFADSDDIYIEVSPAFQYQKRGKFQIVFTVALIVEEALTVTDDIFICCQKLVFSNPSAVLRLNERSVLAVQEISGGGKFEGAFTAYSKFKIGDIQVKPFEYVYYYSKQIDLIGYFANLCFPWMFRGSRGYCRDSCSDWGQ